MSEHRSLNESERALLRKLLVQHFSSSELKILGFDIDVDYEELPGDTKSEKAAELILYVERRQRFHKLFDAIVEQRPTVYWPGKKQPGSEQKSRQKDDDRVYGRSDLMSYWFSMTSPGEWEYSNASLVLDLRQGNPALLDIVELVNIRELWMCSFEYYASASGCPWPSPYNDTQIVENSWHRENDQIIWRPPKWILPAGKCIDAKISFKAKAHVNNGTVFRVKGRVGWLDQYTDRFGQTYTIRDAL